VLQAFEREREHAHAHEHEHEHDATTQKSRGLATEVAGALRQGSARVAAPLRGSETPAEPASMRLDAPLRDLPDPTHCSRANRQSTSYPQPIAIALDAIPAMPTDLAAAAA
jgi:hypothetical protein